MCIRDRVCFADDLQSFAATLAQLQRKAELVAGYAEVTSQEIREKRIPAFEISTNVIKTEQTHCLITYICT